MGNLYRRSEGVGGSHVNLNLDLNSVDGARFAFNLLFAIWVLALAFRSLRIVHARTRGMGVHAPVLSHVIVFFALLFSLTTDALNAAYVALANNLNAVDSSAPTPEFAIMLDWTFVQTDILLAVAFLTFVFVAYRVMRGEALPMWKPALDGTLVCAWTAVMMARLVVYSEVFTRRTISGPTDTAAFRARVKAFQDLTWAMYALQIATTLDVVASAAWLRLQARKTEYTDKAATYLALVTAPLLLIRALFGLAINIVDVEEASSFTFNFDALSLATTIVDGFLLYIAISAFLVGGTVQENLRSMSDGK